MNNRRILFYLFVVDVALGIVVYASIAVSRGWF